jgi:prepilin-type N-terminal cleavage/methylation domain-containing protein
MHRTMHRARRGFTLFELTIVMALMALGAALVVPALARVTDKPRPAAASVLGLLHDARKAAIDRNALVLLVVDPITGRYRADTSGVNGTGKLAEGNIPFDASETLVTDLARLQFVFRPTGAAFADSVLVRNQNGTVLVSVDPWSGVATTDAR